MVSNLNLLESRRRILLNTPHIETISDTIASFETDVATKIKGCKVYFTPIQEGEGDPSPDNVRPIEGWDGIEITHGVNILEGLSLTYRGNASSIYSVNGRISVYTALGNACETFIDVSTIRGRKLTLNHRPTGNSGGFAFYSDKNSDSFISGIGNGNINTQEEWTITVPNREDVNYMRFTANPNYIDNVKILLDAEKTTIPFPQTIYGGYVDLVNGEVVEEYGCKTLNGTEGWLTQAANTTHNLKFLHALGTIPINSALNKGITEYIPEYTSNNQLNKDGILCCRFGWSDRTFYVLNATEYLDGVTDITTFKSYLAEHPLKIVYKLVTPNVYPLTPQTLKALRGRNNIWSDANGNIEVSFYTH